MKKNIKRNNVRVCSLCGRVYIYDNFENNGYEDVCNHCKPIEKTKVITNDLSYGIMQIINK